MKEVVLTKDQFLALAEETKAVELLDRIKLPRDEITLLTDLKRRVSIDETTLSPKEIAEISTYYGQSMLNLLILLIKANSNDSISITTRGLRSHISKENGKIIFRQTYTDPTFMAEREKQEPLIHSIPGTITIDFIFHPGGGKEGGFELDKVIFSNAVLSELIVHPSPNLGELEQAAAKLDAQRGGQRVVTESNVEELFRSRENSPVMSALRQQEDRVPSIAAQMIADKSGKEISLDLDDLTSETLDGGTLLRTTLKNPLFLVGNKVYEIPGTVITDYVKEGNGYKFKEMTCSNAVLYRLILNPPTNPTAQDFKEMRTNAAMQESRTELLQPKKAERNTDIALNEEQLLAITGKKSVLGGALENIRSAANAKGNAVQLEKDKLRGLQIHVPPDIEAEISKYYSQNIISLPNFILMEKSPAISLDSSPENYRSAIFIDKESGNIMLRVELTEPLFALSITGSSDRFDREQAIQGKFAGKITVDYIFKPGEGFELKEMRFSNTALLQLVTDPPKTPEAPRRPKVQSEENMQAYRESVTSYESMCGILKGRFRVLQMEALKEEHQHKSVTPIIPPAHPHAPSAVAPKSGAK